MKRFRLLRRLGEGGMGVVHEALDTERNEHVALKVLRNVNARSILRFKHEFRALQEVHHPNLVTLGELVSEGDVWFFTMELVRGEDFVSWCSALPQVSSSRRDEPTMPAPLSSAPEKIARPAYLGFDEKRLRPALAQLATGLCTLHDAQKVHRDIKPSNVLVDESGRVVILDFGLITDLETEAEADGTTDLGLVGTPSYMAPEQAASKPVGPAADWYAVGALLYEVLTGDVPFSGAPLEVLQRKQTEEPRPPRAISPAVPADLETLCMQLLQFDPNARPTGRQILRLLGAIPERRSSASIPANTLTQGSIFVGRDAELERLRKAYETTREGRALTVLVHGESGVGKSRLIRQFADAMQVSDRAAVVLAGRCYERETVPYKALDGVIDALGRFLARLPASEADTYLPARPGALVQAFPVLRRVPGLAKTRDQARLVDPQEMRRGAFAAIRDMFTRLTERRPVILLIDDLQWADADSLAVLAEVLRPPAPPPLLLLGTARIADAELATTVPTDQSSSRGVTALLRRDVLIHLGRLTRDETRDLARRLLDATAPGISASTEQIAREADGYPLFVDEIVRHAAFAAASLDVGKSLSGSLSLEEALWARISALDTAPRTLVELLAVAGSPLSLEVVSRALHLDGTDFARLTALLRVAHLVRTTGVRAGDRVELYHGRIRSAVLAQLKETVIQAHHEALAIALETMHAPDAEALAAHWLGAGNPVAAAKYMLLAAEDAGEKLAFDQASELYTRALELRTRSTTKLLREEERQLEIKLGDALAKAGRGPAAAESYRSAAVDANAAVKLDLDRRAAEQLLRSGHFDAGLEAIRGVLKTIGLRLPDSPLRLIVELLFLRLLLRLRGKGFKERDPSSIPAHSLMRLDVLWSLNFSLSAIDVVRSRVLQTRYMLFALSMGERAHWARAAAVEVTTAAQDGTRHWARTQRLIESSSEIAARVGTPYAMAWAHGTSGIAWYLRGGYTEGLERCLEAEEMLRETGGGAQWEAATLRIFAGHSLALLGRLKQLAELQPAWVRDALDRGDLYAAVNLRIGFANSARLVADDPLAAREDVTSSMHQWSKQGTHLEHFYELVALVNADLYEGKMQDAYGRVMTQWKPMRRALLTMVQTVRLHLWRMRGQATLACAAQEGAKSSGARLAEATDAAERIEREEAPWGVPFARLLRAGVAGLRGETERAATLYAEAAREAESTEQTLVATVARRCRGKTMGGDEGRAMVEAADAWMRERTVKSPERMAALVAPWIPRVGSVGATA